VVVSVGLTSFVPVAETVPTPWSIVTFVAFVTLQESVDNSSSIMEVRLAVKSSIVGRTFVGMSGLVGSFFLHPATDKNNVKHRKTKSIFLINDASLIKFLGDG